MTEEDVRQIIREELQELFSTDRYTFQKNIQIFNARNIQLGRTNGTKLGTATDQKLGLWNTTPVIQPTGANQGAITNNSGGTRDGTLAAISGSGADTNINNNFTDLHTLLDEIRTALVNIGIIKGSA